MLATFLAQILLLCSCVYVLYGLTASRQLTIKIGSDYLKIIQRFTRTSEGLNMLKKTKGTIILTILFSCIYTHAIVLVTIKNENRDRRSYWVNYMVGYTWDHIVPYADCRDAFIEVMGQNSLKPAQRIYLLTLQHFLHHNLLPSNNNLTENKTRSQRDRCHTIWSILDRQIKCPQKSYPPLELSWDNPDDQLVLTVLLYANGNGCYHSNGHGGIDPGQSLDTRMLTAEQESYIRSNCKGLYECPGSPQWCESFTILLGTAFVQPWERIPDLPNVPQTYV
jgi:hypothetical protein